MPTTYRRPGVYLEESLLVSPSDVAGTTTVGAFVGVTPKGPSNQPVLVESWSDYVTVFGGFDLIQPPAAADTNDVTSRLGEATFADIDALKADATYGDGKYAGTAFTGFQYVLLADGDKVHYLGATTNGIWTDVEDVTRYVAPTGVLPGAAPANLAALKANVTYGDTHYAGTAFQPSQYVQLADLSFAYVTGTGGASVWAQGAMPGTVPGPVLDPKILSFTPYSVYSFFQNGGRYAWIVRAVSSTAAGTAASSKVPSHDTGSGTPSTTKSAFTVVALSVGEWGEKVSYRIAVQDLDNYVFTLQILQKNSENVDEVMETFRDLTLDGAIAGTRRVDALLNDLSLGSRLVRITNVVAANKYLSDITTARYLSGGVEPEPPDVAGGDLSSAAQTLGQVEGPMAINICSFMNDATKADDPDAWEGHTIDPRSMFPDREDVIVINDASRPRETGTSASAYRNFLDSDPVVTAAGGSSYVASYVPWITVPHPTQTGSVVSIPPGGAVMGVMARIDATIGAHRAPAGVIAGIANAVGVQTKFTDSELGDLNYSNLNVVRPVPGSGICIMGARTRKSFGPDRYISARRVLINIKESLRRSTQWAIFENNDERLWSGLRITAENILRPLWEQGGLRGTTSTDAFYIRCDSTINTLAVIASGEVRMEIGVALEYPAEFVVIKITQITTSQFTSEVQPRA